MGLATGLSNEAIFSIKLRMKDILAQIFEKLDTEDMKSKLEEFKDYSGVFMTNENTSTKRAGLLMLECLLMGTQPDKKINTNVEKVVEIIEASGEDVKSFYEEIKDQKELQELMGKSAWKDIGLKKDPKEVFVRVKDQKELLIDSLLLISTYSKMETADQDILLRGVKGALNVRNHPDEDI